MTDAELIVGERTWADEARLVERLRDGDEDVFLELVRAHGPAMQRVAMLFVRNRAVAEEVVQEAWLGALVGIARFEGRSSLKTWLFRILTNIAKTRAEREGRSVPFSALAAADADGADGSVAADRFLPDGDRWANHWSSSPLRFDRLPESRLLAAETLELVQAAVDSLPDAQRAVVTMRDLVGFDATEVCATLGLSEANQRVLLHRGRTKVRDALERYFDRE